jgi:hypothetical protein
MNKGVDIGGSPLHAATGGEFNKISITNTDANPSGDVFPLERSLRLVEARIWDVWAMQP